MRLIAINRLTALIDYIMICKKKFYITSFLKCYI